MRVKDVYVNGTDDLRWNLNILLSDGVADWLACVVISRDDDKGDVRIALELLARRLMGGE